MNKLDRKPLVVFGAGVISEAVVCELESQGYVVEYLCVDEQYLVSSRPPLLEVFDLSEISKIAPPLTHDSFVAVGYQDLNAFRAEKVAQMQALGYRLISSGLDQGGAPNSMISAKALVQTGSSIGRNSFVWDGAIVGHHSVIGNDCWIASGATIGGNCSVGSGSFIGLGAIISHEVKIGQKSIIGAGAVVSRDVEPGGVIFPPASHQHRMKASNFIRLFPL
ncbi:MAG: DapH/DapD/GlmU-related protein [Pontimonas sp.]